MAALASLLTAFRLKTQHKHNFALSLIFLGFSLYLCELILGVFFLTRIGDNAGAAREMGLSFDERTRREVVTDLRDEGHNVFPVVYSNLFWQYNEPVIEIAAEPVLPLAGISGVETVFCNENGRWIVYQSDEYGFNNPSGLYSEDVDIVLLGDSFTHGACVNSEHNTAGVMRSAGNRVLNLRHSGNAPLTMLATIKEYARSLAPKVVLWCYFEGNDLLYDFHYEKNNEILLRYVRDGDFHQGLAGLQPDIDSALARIVEAKIGQAGLPPYVDGSNDGAVRPQSLLRLVNLRARLGLYAQQDRTLSPEDWALFEEALVSAQGAVEEWGGRFYFVYLPTWLRFAYIDNPIYRDSGFHESLRQRLLRLSEKLRIPVIDFVEVFAAHEDALSLFTFRLFNHYNEAGYRLVAEHILERIDGQTTEQGGQSDR